MRQFRLLIAVLALNLLASCGDSKSEDTSATTATAPGTETTAKPVLAGNVDPVCDMEKDDTWTEMIAEGSDTTWFCSSTCKEAYAANPAKYKK